MRSSSGTRALCTTVKPSFVRLVHSVHPRQFSRMSLCSRQTNELDSLWQLLGLLQLEACLLGPSASGTGLSCVPTCHSTRNHQQNRNRLFRFLFDSLLSFLPMHFSLSFLPFLPFRFVPFTCPMSIGADVLCRPKSTYVLCASVHSTQSLVRLAICQGNHLQEITVGCWRVFHHSRHLDRLLEVCTCGNPVLCKVFLPRSKHVTKVASLAVHVG